MGSGRVNLSNLSPAAGARRGPKRIGRGPGSGHGKTATRGSKGQLSRSGTKQYAGFEGGQMPLHRRIPKRGFTNLFRTVYSVVNVGDLNRLDGEISPERLVKEGVVNGIKDGLKILGGGELTKALTIRAHGFSRAAREKIAKAGGTAQLIEVSPKDTRSTDA